MIRLQGGAYSNEGQVEVYCNGQWGTICGAGFVSSDATSLCRQLGYDDYHRFNHLAMLVLLYNEVDKLNSIVMVHLFSLYGALILYTLSLAFVIMLQAIFVQLHQYQAVLINMMSLYNAVSFFVLFKFFVF